MTTIEIKGKRYPLKLDINVVESIQDRYGDIELLHEKLKKASEQKWMLCELVNEGIEYESYLHSSPVECFTPKQIGMLIPISMFTDGTVLAAIHGASEDARSKNPAAGEVET